MKYFTPVCVVLELKEGGIITDIQSENSLFLDFEVKEYKESSIYNWIFEPYRERVKSFLYPEQGYCDERQIGAWFANRANKYYWCSIIIPKQNNLSTNKIIVQDYTSILPKPLNVIEQSPKIYNFFHELDLPLGITDIGGHWIDANPALCSLLGYTRDELLKLSWQDVTDAQNVERESLIYREALNNHQILLRGLTLVEKHYVRKDKTTFRALVHTLAIPDGQSFPISCFFSYIENLDDKERLQKEVENNRAFLRLILDLLPVRVFWKDTDLRYLGCNLAFARDAGEKSPEDVIGKTDYSFPWKTQADMYRQDDRAVISTGVSKVFYEESQTTPDGGLIWLRTSKIPLVGIGGKSMGVLGIYEDITELKAIIDTLNETMSILKALIDSAPMGVVAINTEGNIEFWNKATEEIFGWDSDEVISNPVVSFIPRITQLILDYHKEDSGGENTLSYEFEIDECNKRGELLNLRIIYRSVQITEGKMLHLILIQDITNIKRIQMEQEQLRLQLQHTQKLESLGVMSGAIAHDFNNILMAIMGNIDLALLDLHNPDAIKNYLVGIDESVKSAAELCKELLVFSGKKQQPHQVLNINKIICEMEHLLKISVSKKVLLEFELGTEDMMIFGEPGQFRSILLNLVINASDAIGNHSGLIRVKTYIVDYDTGLMRTAWFKEGIEPKKYVVLEVSDTGCGMDKDVISKIFDPFFTTKDKGRGLGLAMVMGAIRAHSGTIKVYSELGKGTVFKVYLPYTKPNGTYVEVEVQEKWQGKGTILFADDEAIILQITVKMLEKMGFNVISAKDGREAVELFEQNKECICAVILDITMPYLDGIEVARHIRSKSSDIPIFLSSGLLKHTLDEKELGFSIQGFLNKPYNMNVLSKMLQTYLT
ncbi:MAG: PAS domain S-box protein [Candidatus Hydrogenedens sp.]|nr:PAS domain S-box protein [Candidatus Hydrogenedens sp.]